jgi:hypothetical protein
MQLGGWEMDNRATTMSSRKIYSIDNQQKVCIMWIVGGLR